MLKKILTYFYSVHYKNVPCVDPFQSRHYFTITYFFKFNLIYYLSDQCF